MSSILDLGSVPGQEFSLETKLGSNDAGLRRGDIRYARTATISNPSEGPDRLT